MSDDPLLRQVIDLCASVMSCPAPGPDDDLVAAGYLDSLALVELLFELENVLGVAPSLDDLDIEALRTPRSIATLVADLGAGSEGAA